MLFLAASHPLVQFVSGQIVSKLSCTLVSHEKPCEWKQLLLGGHVVNEDIDAEYYNQSGYSLTTARARSKNCYLLADIGAPAIC